MDAKRLREALIDCPDPWILIVGDIDNRLYGQVASDLAWLHTKGNPAVKIVIDSAGGKSVTGRNIYDLIRLYPGRTTGLVINTAKSAATIVLQACDNRLCAEHASILIHETWLDGQAIRRRDFVDEELRNKQIAHLDKHIDLACEIFSVRTGRHPEEIKAVLEKEEEMSPKEALDFGLIDEIV